MVQKRKTTSLFVVCLILGLSLGTATVSAVDTTDTEEINYAVSISKDTTTTSVHTSDGQLIYEGNNDVEAIKAAVNAVDEGIILFNSGTYMVSSAIELKSNTELVGSDAVLKGYSIFNIKNANNVTVRGFEFSNPDQSYLPVAGGIGLIMFENSNNCLIEGNTFTNFRSYGVYLDVSSPSQQNDQITIRDNEFLYFGYCGVMIGKQSSNVYVDNNLFKDINTKKINVNSYGVAVAKGSSAYEYSENIYIRKNTIENNPVWEGIDSHGSRNIFIEDNRITDVKIPIAVSHSTSDGNYPETLHGVKITGNYIQGYTNGQRQDSGIYVIGGHGGTVLKPISRVLISGNTIRDVNNWLVADDGAIVLQSVERAVVTNNDISGVGGTGINLENTDNIIVRSNSIANMKPISGATRGLEIISSGSNLVFENNNFDSTVQVPGV
ncbi:right-handed parallel beta-helix repeat-containing protein [Methanolobus sp. ZRKC2]|uniref:right-handed parallel beta-helix repeat-containing protein n=1 Tax=Methanolobus sp. ZRKC2 TaxID=3125783 RepID=UPI0032442566